jgi:hypothetical protein
MIQMPYHDVGPARSLGPDRADRKDTVAVERCFRHVVHLWSEMTAAFSDCLDLAPSSSTGMKEKPTTGWVVGLVEQNGIEPMTPSLQSLCSPS